MFHRLFFIIGKVVHKIIDGFLLACGEIFIHLLDIQGFFLFNRFLFGNACFPGGQQIIFQLDTAGAVIG